MKLDSIWKRWITLVCSDQRINILFPFCFVLFPLLVFLVNLSSFWALEFSHGFAVKMHRCLPVFELRKKHLNEWWADQEEGRTNEWTNRCNIAWHLLVGFMHVASLSPELKGNSLVFASGIWPEIMDVKIDLFTPEGFCVTKVSGCFWK